jgi:outer membrane protein TolC
MARMGDARRKGIFAPMLTKIAEAVRNLRVFGGFSCFFLIFCGILLAWPLGCPQPAAGAEAAPPPPAPEPLTGSRDFDACVQLALRQSPFFTKSALEIEVRRLDEKDSKSDLFPSLTGSARYYVTQPSNPSVSNPLNYSLAVSTGDYNPLLAYLSLKANRIVTQIATLGHLKAVSKGIDLLGKAFLELGTLEKMAQLQAQASEQAKDNLRYIRERQRLGELSPLEVQIAAQELEVAKAEQEGLAITKARLMEGIRNFLGLKPDEPLHLQVKEARRQVLGDFDPKKVSVKDAEERAFDVRIKRMAKELQTWNITVAKMKFVPSVNMSLQSPDPLTLTGIRGAFVSVGISFPIFDGFKRVRNIGRQKTVLEQFASEEDAVGRDLSLKWREGEEKVNITAAALRTAQASAELARLKETQGETLYRSAEKDYSLVMKARQTRIKAQMDALKKAMEHDQAVLALRSLSGDLVYHYVHEDQFKK